MNCLQRVPLNVMHSKSSHHKKHKKDKKHKHKHRSRQNDDGSQHHNKKRKRKHAETTETSAAAAAGDVIYIDDGAHSVKQLRLDDDNSLQVTRDVKTLRPKQSRGQNFGLGLKALASALASEIWPWPRLWFQTFGFGLASVWLSWPR